MRSETIEWLQAGDVAIQFQVGRDLLERKDSNLQKRIALEGWGKILLSAWHATPRPGWGDDFYQPKWISTHYTLLDLRNLGLSPENSVARQTIDYVLNCGLASDGGIPLGPTTAHHSDVCVNAMFLNYASYFRTAEEQLKPVADSILAEIMPDGGFNCRSTRSGARHSSMHSTISVLEGFYEFQKAGHKYRNSEIKEAIRSSEEFLLMHRLCKSDRTGRIIHKDFLRFSYPCRWKYDVLRALDYFQYAGRKWDSRMQDALDILVEKMNGDGTWNMQAAHPGKQHMIMEKAGAPGRWNTLRALRVLRHFGNP